MKKRILSVILTLCLCIPYQSTAYAAQEGSVQSEEGSTEESAEDAGTREGEDIASQESPAQSEESSTKESAEDAGTREGEDIASQEPPAQSEESSTKESAEDAGIGEGGDTTLSETSEQPEESSIEESFIEESFIEETEQEVETNEDADTDLQSEDILMKRSMKRSAVRNVTDLSPAAVYQAMIALKDQDGYREGTTWTNDEPYSDSKGNYHWNGGTINGVNISAAGCAAFAFVLSDTAFGSLQNRIYAKGQFEFEDIKAGDILQVNNDSHTVIVLEVSDAGVVVAEGNYNGKVHWGRSIDKEEVMSSTSHYITRYPEDYVRPDDPEAGKIIDDGTLDGGLTWNLTGAGILTILGTGAMPDFGSPEEQPWRVNDNSSKIRKVVIGDGVTSIGSCAFWNCGVLSAEISSSVTTIGNSAFRESSIISATIPSSVAVIGDSAFQGCQGLGSVTVSNGLETIGQNAFRACTSLKSISLPASVEEVGAAAFFECSEMTSAVFASGNGQVQMGDNTFTRCWRLQEVKLPSGIDCISKEMFLNCLMLVSVEIPQGAENIKESAFSSCSRLTTVIIPSSVTTIDRAAFASCPLTDIFFTDSEAQWNSISIIGDTASAVSKATMHYNYVPVTNPDPDEGDNDNNSGENDGSNNGDNNNGNNSESDHDSDRSGNNSGEDDSDESTLETAAWKPTTPDEIKRYDCVGKEAVRYTLPEENVYPIDIENAVQGPMCFAVFESVLGDYTIGRTYNIYALSDITYSTDQEVQITLEIPSALYKKDRDYKMVCVTKGGQPYIYEDMDNNPGTITIKTDKFFAYALIYK